MPALLVVACLLLGGCSGAGEEGGDQSDGDGSSASAVSGESGAGTRHEVSGLRFDLPGWRALQAGSGDAAAAQLAEQLGLGVERLDERLSAGGLVLVPEGSDAEDYLPTVNAYAAPGGVPTDEEIEQDFARIGAEVADITRTESAVGEVAVVSYRTPTGGTTVEGATVVAPAGDQIVLVAVSEVERGRADEVAAAVVESLAGS